MKIFTQLYGRMAATLLLLFILLGGALIYISYKTSELYALEISQRINRDIAQHAAEDLPLFKNGEVNKAALKQLAHQVMVINPIVEVYLLDRHGNILSHALPAETVLLNSVNLAPLHTFIDQSQALPIFADDPRSPDQQKVFSVSAIKEQGVTVAYLYTVLNGKSHDSLRQSLQDSYIFRTASATILASLLISIIAGLVIFSPLSKRLRKLLKAVRVYRSTGFLGKMPALATPLAASSRPDEIDELTIAISDMSTRIEQQFQALQEVDKNRRELIANVSHDLRTPLASMQGYLETILIKHQDLSIADQHSYLQTAYKQSRRLNQLIGELFELAKLESGNIEPDWQEFPFMELIQDLIQDYQNEAKQRGVGLAVQCENMHITVYADIALIHRVLENLLQNALRHTSDGGEITFKVREDHHKVWIEVIDNGEGIASHEIPHIFERYYQPNKQNNHNGHGLGLAIVKRIIELHRSQVNVSSSSNIGTAFIFWLPHAA